MFLRITNIITRQTLLSVYIRPVIKQWPRIQQWTKSQAMEKKWTNSQAMDQNTNNGPIVKQWTKKWANSQAMEQ